MNISLKKLWIYNIAVSVILLVTLILFRYNLVVTLGNFLVSVHKPMSFQITIIDLVLVSFIPVWALLLYRRKENISIKTIILCNGMILLSLTIVIILAFIYCDRYVPSPSPLSPDYVVLTPFPFFWTLILFLGIFLPYVWIGVRTTKQ